MISMIRVLGTLVTLAVLAGPANALNPTAKCDRMKVRAAGKVFAQVLLCFSKNLADPSFDENLCSNLAHEKCVEAFNKADAKGGCFAPGNGPPICDQIRDSAIIVYDDI